MKKSTGIILGVISMIASLSIGLGIGYKLKDNNMGNVATEGVKGENIKTEISEDKLKKVINNDTIDYSILFYDLIYNYDSFEKSKVYKIQDLVDTKFASHLFLYSSKFEGACSCGSNYTLYSKEYLQSLWTKLYGNKSLKYFDKIVYENNNNYENVLLIKYDENEAKSEECTNTYKYYNQSESNEYYYVLTCDALGAYYTDYKSIYKEKDEVIIDVYVSDKENDKGKEVVLTFKQQDDYYYIYSIQVM